MNKTLELIVIILLVSACSSPVQKSERPTSPSPRHMESMVKIIAQAETVQARLRGLQAGNALFDALESRCIEGKMVEVIVPQPTAHLLEHRKTCFAVYVSAHPEARPQLDVMLINNWDIYVGPNYFGTHTYEFFKEEQFQNAIKLSSQRR